MGARQAGAFRRQKVFITGGAGFIGSNLVDCLLAMGHQVTVYDNLVAGKREWIEHQIACPAFRFIHADILDMPRLLASLPGHDVVWHLAANGDIRLGHQQTDLDLKQSVEATRNVLEAMRECDVQDILFSSSGSVYGEIDIVPTPETAGPLLPLSLYAASKLSAESFISAFCSLFDRRAWIFRFGNVVGPRMSRGVIFDFIQKLRKNPQELEVLGDGQQDKPYFTVDECIDGMLHAYSRVPMTAGRPCDVFNLGSASTTRVQTIAQIVIEEMGLRDVRLVYTGGRTGWPGDQPQVHLSFEKMARYGWKARRTSDQAVREAAQILLSAAANG